MKNHKNTVCAVICAVLILSLCSCSYSQSGDSSSKSGASSVDTKPSTASEQSPIEYEHGKKSLAGTNSEEIYNCLADAVNSDQPKEFTVYGQYNVKDIAAAIYAYKDDHPEVFWLSDEFNYIINDSYVSVEPTFYLTGYELIKKKNAFDEKLNEIVSNAPENASPYEYEIYVNDYIIDNCHYDDESAKLPDPVGDSNDAAGVLVDGLAVCEGYSRAFQLLCRELGVESVPVSGMSDGELHMWNCAKIDGSWYNVDVTWNDLDEGVEYARYLNFNVPDSIFQSDHKPHKTYNEITSEEYEASDYGYNTFLPSCNSTDYYYYERSCPKLTSLDDTEEISQYIANQAKEGKDIATITVDESLNFDDTYSELINGRLYEIIERSNELGNGEFSLNRLTYMNPNAERRTITVELYYE